MKLIHKSITTLGIATLLGGISHAVHAQPATEKTPVLTAQMNNPGSYNQGPGGFNRGGSYNQGPPGGFNRGGSYNQGPPGGFNRGGSYNQGPPGGFNRRGSYNQGPPGGFEQQNVKREIEGLNQAIQQNPKFVEGYNHRALARFMLGDKQGAIADLQQAANLYLEQGNQNKYQQTLLTIKEMQ